MSTHREEEFIWGTKQCYIHMEHNTMSLTHSMSPVRMAYTGGLENSAARADLAAL